MSLMNEIEHVVVLMLENRSFDSILGNCYVENRVPGTSLNNESVHQVFIPSSSSNIEFRGRCHFQNQMTEQAVPQPLQDCFRPEITVGIFPEIGPGEFIDHVAKQLYNNESPDWSIDDVNIATRMEGTMADYETKINEVDGHETLPFRPQDILSMFDAKFLPVINSLASSFAVCDEWFCSVPSQTWPNRLFLHSGTSCGIIKNETKGDLLNALHELLQTSHPSVFSCMKKNAQIVCGNSSLDQASLSTVLHPQDRLFSMHFQSMRNFKKQCSCKKNDRQLPNYTFIEPRFWSSKHGNQNDQHPLVNLVWNSENAYESDITVHNADDLILEIYQSMFIDIDPKKSEEERQNIIKKRMFIILYDEHGGNFDHIFPPSCVVPDRNSDFPYFKRLGVRVPAVFISPLIAEHTILRSNVEGAHFDHTSLIKSLSQRFKSDFKGNHIDTPLTARTMNAPSFWHVLSPLPPSAISDPSSLYARMKRVEEEIMALKQENERRAVQPNFIYRGREVSSNLPIVASAKKVKVSEEMHLSHLASGILSSIKAINAFQKLKKPTVPKLKSFGAPQRVSALPSGVAPFLSSMKDDVEVDIRGLLNDAFDDWDELTSKKTVELQQTIAKITDDISLGKRKFFDSDNKEEEKNNSDDKNNNNNNNLDN